MARGKCLAKLARRRLLPLIELDKSCTRFRGVDSNKCAFNHAPVSPFSLAISSLVGKFFHFV